MIFDKMKHEDETFDDKNEMSVKKEITAKAMKVKIKNEENEPKEYEAENESKNLYDEVVPKSVSIDDVIGMHDMKYMQVLIGTGKKDEVTRLSQLSQSSLLSQLQPEGSMSLTSSCSCQAESEVCCEVTTALTAKVPSMASKVSTCMTWCRQIWVAVYAVTERPTAGITTAMLDMVARIASTASAVVAWLRRILRRFVS